MWGETPGDRHRINHRNPWSVRKSPGRERVPKDRLLIMHSTEPVFPREGDPGTTEGLEARQHKEKG